MLPLICAQLHSYIFFATVFCVAFKYNLSRVSPSTIVCTIVLRKTTELEYQACQFFSCHLYSVSVGFELIFFRFCLWEKNCSLKISRPKLRLNLRKPSKRKIFLGRNALQIVIACTPLRIVCFLTLDIERILFGFTLLLRVVTRVLSQYNILFLRKFRFSWIFTIFKKYF